jgi:hypothetical protein
MKAVRRMSFGMQSNERVWEVSRLSLFVEFTYSIA